MNLTVFSIILNGMPFLPMQFAMLNRLNIRWRWICVEGAAANTNCTAWCVRQPPQLSRDGSQEFLDSISTHPRVTIVRKPFWQGGKVEMCNAALELINEPCVLLESDVDELFETVQIERMVQLFDTMPKVDHMRFWCRFFLGPNIVATSSNGYGNRANSEWLRAWRFSPGQRFSRHEPPALPGSDKFGLSRDETKAYKLVFDHLAYFDEKQVANKCRFYNYANGVNHWRRLQQNKTWPVKDLRTFLPWVGPGASADLLFK